jgi:hypothetical protein
MGGGAIPRYLYPGDEGLRKRFIGALGFDRETIPPMSDQPFDPAQYGIRTVELGPRTFFLLGTAHVSADSVTAVEDTIARGGMDHVCIEIDEGRYRSVARKNDWSRLDIFQVIRRRQAFLLLSNLVLSSFQRRMGENTGVAPGSEMIAAVNRAKEAGIAYSFGDRPVQRRSAAPGRRRASGERTSSSRVCSPAPSPGRR